MATLIILSILILRDLTMKVTRKLYKLEPKTEDHFTEVVFTDVKGGRHSCDLRIVLSTDCGDMELNMSNNEALRLINNLSDRLVRNIK